MQAGALHAWKAHRQQVEARALRASAWPGSSYVPAEISLGQSGGRLSTSLAQLNANTRAPEERGPQSFDLWGELTFGSAEFGSNEYDYQIAHLGADWLVSETALVGLMGQYDKLDGSGTAPEGDGWMFGPYATVRLAENLYGDVRAAWGRSDNTVSPLGTFRDGFETSRAFYTGSLIGVFDIGDASRFRRKWSCVTILKTRTPTATALAW